MNDRVPNIDPAHIVDCWGDDERMNFLFSAFPPTRSANPHHWDTKMSFWKNLIHEMNIRSNYGFITWDNLFSQLSRHGKHPLGMQVIFEELSKTGELVSTIQYTQDIEAYQSWVGWGLKWCVKKPVTWMTNKVLSPIKSRPDKELKKGQFVLVSALEKKCEKVVSKFHEYTSGNKHDYDFLSIISYPKLQELVKDIFCDSQSVHLALATLRRNKVIEIWSPDETAAGVSNISKQDSLSERYIKFAKKGENVVSPFTEVDVGIVRLSETKTHLHDIINKYYEEIEQCTQKARECLKNKQKTLAKNALRRKKRIEISLEKKEQTLDNVEQLLESLHQCKTDKTVMETYKAAVAAYKDASNELSTKEVQETMDDVFNVLDVQADITEILAGPVVANDTDTQDLEAELTALLDAQANDNAMDVICGELNGIKIDERLPDVPAHSPKSVVKSHKEEALLQEVNYIGM